MNNKLFLVSGHSGSGKTSLMKPLMSNEVISFTTRSKRKGEIEGSDYKFITKEEFDALKKSDKLIEHVEYGGNYYGIDEDELYSKLEKGHAFCIVDNHGREQLQAIYSNTTSIFLYCDYHDTKERMLKRGDSLEDVEKRLSSYYKEMLNSVNYDYVIYNKNYLFTKAIVGSIIASEVLEK